MDDTERTIRRIEEGIVLAPTLRSRPGTQPLAERMALLQVPGVSVAVIADGRLAWARGWGVREAGGSDPVTETTLFQAASISKAVAALAVMRLVQEGRLSLDEDVNAYLRIWRVPANDDWQPRITLRQLLGHVAGTTVHGFPGYRRDRPLPTLPQVLDADPPANTPPVRVNVAPGLQFRYSGGGTSIVQQVLMDATGKPFPALMRELVLGPLRMERSTYDQPLPASRWAEAATGHREDGVAVAGGWHVYPEMAAAGLWTTPSDLARVALEVQEVLAGRAGKVLTKESVEAMLAPQAGGPVGIGFFLQGEGEQARFGHDGSNAGFLCALTAYAGRGLGAAVMINGEHWVGAMVQEVLGAIAREYDWPLAPGERIGLFEPPRPPVSAGVLNYAGEYEVQPGYRVQVVEEGGPALQLPGQAPLRLAPISETAFYAEALDLEVEFRRDGAGRATALVMRQNGTSMDAARLDR
jgi:CubicO group peptidase (beta-lactamase class C family)